MKTVWVNVCPHFLFSLVNLSVLKPHSHGGIYCLVSFLKGFHEVKSLKMEEHFHSKVRKVESEELEALNCLYSWHHGWVLKIWCLVNERKK